ncbi:hypothetical protein NAT51_19425 [Flavobacterium amniphilum]|uniref:hypothetical protein n=1 Tax=Flavobacterium amniphilum TaxID=1834035 RepID=UPI002029EFBD|nr:hypothetical protein [Flavobacterium amniphilum]MCL9807698.1 hypothetical protein [Flavobacterium amniphilum]
MKQQLFILTFFYLCINFCIGQNQYIGREKLNNNLKNHTIIDETTGIKFTLDSTQIYVSAIDKSGKQIWRTDPWKDNELTEYRVKRPIIVEFKFINEKWKDNKKVIWIVYNNSQFGTIDLTTGEFEWHGQD